MIRAGQVEVYHEGQGGRTVATAYEHVKVFGGMAMFSGKPRNANIHALTPVEALKLTRSEFDGLLKKYSGMQAILEHTAAEHMAQEDSSKSLLVSFGTIE